MKKIGNGDGKRRVTTIAFEVNVYPDKTRILKRLLCRASASDDMPPNDDNIHLVAYSLTQYTTSELYRTQILKQNNFLHNIAAIPIVNIDPDTMYNEVNHKLVSSTSIKGIEKTHPTHSRGKLLIVTTEKIKSASQQEIYQIINAGEIPISKQIDLIEL